MTSIVYYSVFLALGALVAFEDWTHKRIRNRLILWGLGACAAGLGWYLANSALGHSRLRLLGLGEYYLPWGFYPSVLAHAALSLAAAVSLWCLSVWPAGDAKFFAVLSTLAALVDPNLPGFPRLLFLLLLVNIFVPAGLLFAAEALVLLVARLATLRPWDWWVGLKSEASRLGVRAREAWPLRYDYLMLAANLFVVFLALQLELPRLGALLPEPWGSLSIFLLMTAGWPAIAGALRRRSVGAAAFALVCGGALAGRRLWGWDVAGLALGALRTTLNFGLFLSVGRGVFGWIIERQSLGALEAEHVREGLVLSEDTWNRLGLEERYSDGLSREDAETVRGRLLRRGAAGFQVYRTIPFGVWIFFGTLLTLSGRVNSVAVLVSWFWRAREVCKAAAAGWLS